MSKNPLTRQPPLQVQPKFFVLSAESGFFQAKPAFDPVQKRQKADIQGDSHVFNRMIFACGGCIRPQTNLTLPMLDSRKLCLAAMCPVTPRLHITRR